MKRSLLFAVCGLWCLCPLWAADTPLPSLAQFEHHTTLSDGHDDLRKVELSYEVLHTLQRRREVQVFNANGDPIPSRVFDARGNFETLEQERALSIFPVQRKVEQGETRYSVQVTNEGEQTAINLSAPDEATSALEDYVISVDRKYTRTLGSLVALRLVWAAVEQNLLVPIVVEGSTDLKAWRTLVDDAVVSDLKHNGVNLRKNEIEFRAFDGEYLRITWPRSPTPLTIEAITGVFSKSRSAPSHTETVDCQPDTPANQCWFAIGATPVTTLHLATEATEYFLQARLASRHTTQDDWIDRGEIQQYRLQVDDTTVEKADNEFPDRADPMWRVEYVTAAAARTQQVRIGWAPLYLAFIAEGPGPFVLGFGLPQSTTVALHGAGAVDAILARGDKRIEDIEVVTHAGIVDNVVETPFWTRDRIETYTLWAVLLFGVGIMLWIALGLFRRMQSET
jgi:hypothetical protein